MRALMMGMMLASGLLLTTAVQASAHDWNRIEHQCRHGNQHACHLLRLHRECQHGREHACRELRRM